MSGERIKETDLAQQELAPAPLLVSQFEAMREDPGAEPSLEDFPLVFDRPEYRKHCFEEARKAFLFVFQSQKVADYLASAPSKEGIQYLKKVRRFGLMLKSSYKFFDAAHFCPEALHRFLSELGDHNDRYYLPLRAEVSGKMLGAKESWNGISDDELTFNPAQETDFQSYAKEVSSRIEDLAGRESLSVPEFHELRRKIRLHMNLMQVPAAEHQGENQRRLFYALYLLSAELGEKHDDLVQRGLRGGIDYEKSVVKLDPSIADRTRALLPFIEKAVGLSA